MISSSLCSLVVCVVWCMSAHVAKNFNLYPGGAVPIVCDIFFKADPLGSFSHDKKLKPGDACYHVFTELDNPPKGNESMPKMMT